MNLDCPDPWNNRTGSEKLPVERLGDKKHKEWTARQKKKTKKNKKKQKKTKNKNKNKKPHQADKFCLSQAGFIPIETGNGEGK